MVPRGLPSTLRICGTVWAVEYVEGLRGERGHFGSTDPGLRRIRIALDQHPDVMRSTLLHEAIHAALSLGGVSVFDADDEERFCRVLEVPLLSLIRDNRIKW